MKYTQTTKQHTTKPNTTGLQAIIQQCRRARAWSVMLQSKAFAKASTFQPFAYQGE